jgi:hypothetical protein
MKRNVPLDSREEECPPGLPFDLTEPVRTSFDPAEPVAQSLVPRLWRRNRCNATHNPAPATAISAFRIGGRCRVAAIFPPWAEVGTAPGRA